MGQKEKSRMNSGFPLTSNNYCNTIIVAGIESSNDPEMPKRRKPGRPRLPKGEAKGRIVPIRFTADALKAIAAKAKEKDQTISDWIRSTVDAALE
ncbi:MAG TPA: hypothetical protein VI685_05110 [Candidatus Angelobacter sp.]